jgi:hypothetical protein
VSKTLENGSFQDAVGTVVNGGTIEFVLSHDAMIIAGGQVAPTRVTATLDSSGDMPSAFTILANDELTPTGTFYLTTVFDSNGARVFGPERWVFSGASPIDLDTLTPTIVDPAFANPVLQDPAAAQTITGFGLTATSTAPFTIDTEAVGHWNTVRVVDGSKYTTIQAAYDNAKAQSPKLSVFVPPGTYALGATGLTFDTADTSVVFSPQAVLTYSGTAAAITISGSEDINVLGYPKIDLSGNSNAASGVLINAGKNHTLQIGEITGKTGIVSGQVGVDVQTSGTGAFLLDIDITSGHNLDIILRHNGNGGGSFYKVRARNGGITNKVVELTDADVIHLEVNGSGASIVDGIDFAGTAKDSVAWLYFEGSGDGVTFGASSESNFVYLVQTTGTAIVDSSAATAKNLVYHVRLAKFVGVAELTNTILPVANPLEGALSNMPRWIFKQVDHTDMTAASTADTFTLWTFPANTMIHDIVGTVVTAWEAAVGLSAAVGSVGVNGGSANDLVLDDNFFSAATIYELHDATASGGKGTLLFDSTDKFAPYMFVAGGVVELQMDLTGDDHADTNAGQARIYALVSQPLGNTTTEAN